MHNSQQNSLRGGIHFFDKIRLFFVGGGHDCQPNISGTLVENQWIGGIFRQLKPLHLLPLSPTVTDVVTQEWSL